jgi:membrane fusion protein (multidrug efflux system)
MSPIRRPLPALAWAVSFLAACGPSTQGAEDPPLSGVRAREAVRVVTAPVESREMLRRLETTTRIESQTQVQVVPRLNGVVTEVHAEEGQAVETGQLLAVLDDRELVIAEADSRAALEEARTRLPLLKLAVREAEERLVNARLAFEQAGRDHERNVAIATSGENSLSLLSQRDLDQSRLLRDQRDSEHRTAQLSVERSKLDVDNGEALVRRAELALERASLSLSHTRITSPIKGVVAERNVRVGETTGARVGDIAGSSGTPFVITAPDDLRAVFYRPQRELGLFRQGARQSAQGDGSAELDVEVSAEALPGRRFVGRIERVSPTIDPASGNFRVTAVLEPQAVDDPLVRLLPGMLVRLTIVTERHADALVVPKRAVRREGERSVVFAVRDGLAASVAVREGFSDDESVELLPLEGEVLAAGEPVIVVGNRDLEHGARVLARDAADHPVADGEVATEAPAAAPSDG